MVLSEDFLAAMEKQTAAIEENNTLTKGYRQEDNIGAKVSKEATTETNISADTWRRDDTQDELRQSFIKLIGQSAAGVLGPQAQQGLKAIAPLFGLAGFAMNSELRGSTVDRLTETIEGHHRTLAETRQQLAILESEPRILAPKPAPGATFQ